jgi:hypothetical protein
MSGMKNPVATGALVGIATFIASYVALLGFAMVRFAYYSGPAPDLFYAVPLPLAIGSVAAMIAFLIKRSN